MRRVYCVGKPRHHSSPSMARLTHSVDTRAERQPRHSGPAELGRWEFPWNQMKGTKGCMIPITRNAPQRGLALLLSLGAHGIWDELDLSMRRRDLGLMSAGIQAPWQRSMAGNYLQFLLKGKERTKAAFGCPIEADQWRSNRSR